MSVSRVRAAEVQRGRGPHPAASPFDRRISERLGLRAFEVDQVELPPGERTVEHDHLDNEVEDMYAFVSGSGWLVVGDSRMVVAAGEFVAVTKEERRYVLSGYGGLVLIAVCSVAAATT